MTKHKPATPLPTGEITSADLLALTLPTLQQLVARSDAYPKLVAALQDAISGRDSNAKGYVTFERASALLRELGELQP